MGVAQGGDGPAGADFACRHPRGDNFPVTASRRALTPFATQFRWTVMGTERVGYASQHHDADN